MFATQQTEAQFLIPDWVDIVDYVPQSESSLSGLLKSFPDEKFPRKNLSWNSSTLEFNTF